MPVLAPLGDFAGFDLSLVITTWSAAAGWLRLVVPTNAILVVGLALARGATTNTSVSSRRSWGSLLSSCLRRSRPLH
jgi:hypothetical protein